jgi:hypothetical protein
MSPYDNAFIDPIRRQGHGSWFRTISLTPLAHRPRMPKTDAFESLDGKGRDFSESFGLQGA